MSISMTSLYFLPIMDTSSDWKSGFYSKSLQTEIFIDFSNKLEHA